MNRKDAGREILETADERSVLRCRPSAGDLPGEFIGSWIHLCAAPFFLPWRYHQRGAVREAYCDLGKTLSLENFSQTEHSPEVLLSVLWQYSSALLLLNDSVPGPESLLLEPGLIRLEEGGEKNRKQWHLRLILHPYYNKQRNGQTAETRLRINKMTESLIRRAASGGKFKRNGRYAELLAASEDYAELCRLTEVALGKKAAVMLPSPAAADFIKDTGAEDPAAEKKSGAQAEETAGGNDKAAVLPAAADDRKGFSIAEKFKAFKSKMNLPFFLLLCEAFILLSLLILDRFFRPYPFSLLIALTGLLALCCIGQLFLLLLPVSPYALWHERRVKAVTDTAVRSLAAENELSLHADHAVRTAVLTLLNRPLKNGSSVSWQIIADEFLIGSEEDKCNLCLCGIAENSGNILRILRRGGTFYAQALSSTESVYLEERILYRHEEYELPDECRIRIRQLIFRFRAY